MPSFRIVVVGRGRSVEVTVVTIGPCVADFVSPPSVTGVVVGLGIVVEDVGPSLEMDSGGSPSPSKLVEVAELINQAVSPDHCPNRGPMPAGVHVWKAGWSRKNSLL
jgi:hypothetical protein